MSSALVGIAPIDRKETLGVLVREKLRAALMAGRFRAGEKLTIRAVASALDVSLTPAREALYNLVAEGALESGPNGTIFIPQLDEERIVELRKIRIALEGLAAREAARRLTDAQVAELAAINAALVEADRRKDYSELMRHNWQFHFGIYEAAAMPTLERMIESCWLKMGSYLNVIYPRYGETGKGLELHGKVLEALQRRDADALCQAIRADIEQSTAYLIAMTRGPEPSIGARSPGDA